MQVSNQVPAKEPDTNSIGAKKLNSTAKDRERRKFDGTIVNLTCLMADRTVLKRCFTWGNPKTTRRVTRPAALFAVALDLAHFKYHKLAI
jgi:hypothetical protein